MVFNPFIRVSGFAKNSPYRTPARIYELAKATFQHFYKLDPGRDFQDELTTYLRSEGVWSAECMQLERRREEVRAAVRQHT